MKKNKIIVIGIAGASGSGKTQVAKAIKEKLESRGIDVSIVKQDRYYHDLSHMDLAKRRKQNFDHPRAFDYNLLLKHIVELKLGNDISVKEYDYKESIQTDKIINIQSAHVIIVEGILVLHNKKLRNLMDYKFFVDVPIDECFIRRDERDEAERDRSSKEVRGQYRRDVKPMYLKFVEPSGEYADMKITEGAKNKNAIDIIVRAINSLIFN